MSKTAIATAGALTTRTQNLQGRAFFRDSLSEGLLVIGKKSADTLAHHIIFESEGEKREAIFHAPRGINVQEMLLLLPVQVELKTDAQFGIYVVSIEGRENWQFYFKKNGKMGLPHARTPIGALFARADNIIPDEPLEILWKNEIVLEDISLPGQKTVGCPNEIKIVERNFRSSELDVFTESGGSSAQNGKARPMNVPHLRFLIPTTTITSMQKEKVEVMLAVAERKERRGEVACYIAVESKGKNEEKVAVENYAYLPIYVRENGRVEKRKGIEPRIKACAMQASEKKEGRMRKSKSAKVAEAYAKSEEKKKEKKSADVERKSENFLQRALNFVSKKVLETHKKLHEIAVAAEKFKARALEVCALAARVIKREIRACAQRIARALVELAERLKEVVIRIRFLVSRALLNLFLRSFSLTRGRVRRTGSSR
ncbi:MAG: hypothetical protein ABIH99_06150 [Candidatus Micrarchaeota archaeon]